MGRGKLKPRKILGGGIFSWSDLCVRSEKKFWVRPPASRGKGGGKHYEGPEPGRQRRLSALLDSPILLLLPHL